MKIKLLIAICFFSIGLLKSQIITTVAGNGVGGSIGNGGQATVAELNYPQAVLFDGAGNMYIADTDNNLVRKVNTSGIITTIVGTGIQGYSGDGGQATAANINYPRGLVFDVAGNLYVTEAFGCRVRKITPSGIITTFAGTGTAGYSGDGGQATAAQLHTPYVSIFDSAGNLYIADYDNNCVRKINTSGIISTIAGIGIGGYSGDGGQATNAKLNLPAGLTLDGIGNIYISDSQNQRVRKVDVSGVINTIAGNGIGSFSGDCGQATAAELYHPFGIVIDPVGNLYISDAWNNRIRKVTASGIITTIAGNGFGGAGTGGYSGDGGAALAAELYWPAGLAVDALNNLYIADSYNLRIRKVTNAGATLSVNSPTICAGSTATLTATGATSYTWSTGDNTASISPTVTTTTNYTVTGAGASTCTNVATATITVNPSPIISVSDATVCIGETATLTATGAMSYTWSTGDNTASISPTVTTTTNYTVTGAGASNCTNFATVTATVTVNPLPTVFVSDATVCIGETAILIATGAMSYTWSTGATITSVIVSPTVTTSYTVVGEMGTCINQAVAIVNVNSSIPKVNINNSDTICLGESITLEANGGVGTYTWSTGEITASINVSPTLTTTYTVISGGITCNNQATAIVAISNILDFTLPNIVTPNNDGINDFIDFGKYQFTSMQLEIYDRWGIKIIESNDSNFIWRPTTIVDGTYYYIIQYAFTCDKKGQSKIAKGFITSLK